MSCMTILLNISKCKSAEGGSGEGVEGDGKGATGRGGKIKQSGDGEGEKKGQEEGRFHRWI